MEGGNLPPVEREVGGQDGVVVPRGSAGDSNNQHIIGLKKEGKTKNKLTNKIKARTLTYHNQSHAKQKSTNQIIQ